MAGYATLIKYALWAALIILCTLFVGHIATNIHDGIFEDGRTAERAEWLEKEEKRSKELAQAVADAAQAMAKEREKQTTALTEALENEIIAKDKLNNDLAGVRAANRGLWIDAKNCADRAAGATAETQGTGLGGSETGRIRLPGQIEQNLWELAADAQRVVIQYETLRKTCLPLVEVMPDING
ncbi:MAG: hypothetical protein HRU77_04010 [Gammaproteobacteria bacterium]|nr:MAG: hypothetical protein HRU77_04010 [Gammaproteobacteria bacterium]